MTLNPRDERYSRAATFKTAHTVCPRRGYAKVSQDAYAYFILPLSCMRAVAVVRKKPFCVRQRASTLRRTPLFCSSSSSCSSQLPSEPGWPRSASGKWCGREPSAFGAFGRHQGRGPLLGRCGAQCGPRSVLRASGAQRAAVRKHQGRKGPQAAGAAGAMTTSFWSVLRGRGLTSTECHAIV